MFTFTSVDDFEAEPFADKDIRALLTKWGILPHSSLHKFSFDQAFDGQDSKRFINELLSSEPFRAFTSKVPTKGPNVPITDAQATKLSLTHFSMDFFDKMTGPIVRPDGTISKCMPDVFDGIPIHNQLQTSLLNEDDYDGHYDLFTPADRKEFLYHLMETLVVGGGMCQFEDEWTPYEDTIRKLYKHFVAVFRNSQTKQIESQVLVYSVDRTDGTLWHDARLNETHRVRMNRCYVCVNAFTRTVEVWVIPFVEVFA